MFEAINLIINQGADCDEKLKIRAIDHLGKFISVREPNIRYLGLTTMSLVANLGTNSDNIKAHQATILYSLKDADISIRKRALHLLFAMCDASNAIDIVRELLNYLMVADALIKEEMVLKIAILAERFAPDFFWFFL